MRKLDNTKMGGALKKRPDGSPFVVRVHVETEYLDGMRAIAGYVIDVRGQVLVVVFFINHERARYAAYAQDALLEWIRAGATDRFGCCSAPRQEKHHVPPNAPAHIV